MKNEGPNTAANLVRECIEKDAGFNIASNCSLALVESTVKTLSKSKEIQIVSTTSIAVIESLP